MVVFHYFTGQTGSLFEKPGQYGSPGRAVVLHMFICDDRQTDRPFLMTDKQTDRRRDKLLGRLLSK